MALHDRVTVLIDVGTGSTREEILQVRVEGAVIDVQPDTDPVTFTEVSRKGLAIRTISVARARLIAYIEEPHRG